MREIFDNINPTNEQKDKMLRNILNYEKKPKRMIWLPLASAAVIALAVIPVSIILMNSMKIQIIETAPKDGIIITASHNETGESQAFIGDSGEDQAFIGEACSFTAPPRSKYTAYDGALPESALETDENTEGVVAFDAAIYYPFEYNRYTLTSDYEKAYGEPFVILYQEFVDKIYNYEKELYCPDSETANALMQCISVSNPAISSVVTYESDFYSAETQTIKWDYALKTKEELDTHFQSFEDRITQLIGYNINPEENDVVKAMKLYKITATSITYDYNADETDYSDSTYNAITNGTGASKSYAQMYTYLLLQEGIDANICLATSSDSSVADEWVVLKLDSNYYFADPVFESKKNGGKGLSYFGMTSKELYNISDFNIGYTNKINSEEIKDKAIDIKFKALRNSTSWWNDGDEKIHFNIDVKEDVLEL